MSPLSGWTAEAGIQQYETETGEQRTIDLADGSHIFLDVESKLRVLEPDGSKVYLEAGQAAFDLAKDSNRPFTVQIGQGSVQAVRSQFNVRRKVDLTVISIFAGQMRVVSATGKANITAPKVKPLAADRGRQVILASDGTLSKPVDLSTTHLTLWRERRLSFRDNTLVEIAEEFNRYNKTPKLRVEGDFLKQRTFTGVLDANDPQTFLDYLARDQRVELDYDQPDLIVVRFRSRYGFARLQR